jgi:hypothetical protein
MQVEGEPFGKRKEMTGRRNNRVMGEVSIKYIIHMYESVIMKSINLYN